MPLIRCKTYFGVQIDRMWDQMWSIGICLSHDSRETYLFINLFKFSISIGKLTKWEGEEYDDE